MKNNISLFIFFRLYPDEESCFSKLVEIKYPYGIYCRNCQRVKNFTKHKGRPVYQCSCGYQQSVLTGTIFQNSATNLQYWFFAIFALVTTKNGLSAMQLQRMLGINYRTCWRMLHKIRSVMTPSVKLLKGEVEMDETFLNWAKLKRRYRNNFAMTTKASIWGAVERGGEARFEIIDSTGYLEIRRVVQKHLSMFSQPRTDQGYWYRQLKKIGYKDHKSVLHRKEYVREDDPNVHTQTIESLWSQYKRNLIGTYRGAVSVKYLKNYNNEYTWRYSKRNSENPFELLLKQAVTSTGE